MAKISVVFVLLAASLAQAAQPLYGQCGGVGYTGDTTCVSGGVCTKVNDFYSQCLPGTAAPTTSSTTTTTTTTTSTTTTTTVTSVPVPSKTPIAGADPNTAAVVTAFNQYNVTTRFGLTFNPSAILGVRFSAQSQSFKAGQDVARNITLNTPELSLWGVQDPGLGPFVIVMADPDVPTPANPSYSPVRHWLAGNYYGTPTSNVLTPSGTAITPYFQPTPGVGSPAHRYTYLLYKQPDNFNQQRVVTSQTSIVNWNVTQFAAQTGLGNPIAGTFMMTVM